jgi:hypothetical protein
MMSRERRRLRGWLQRHGGLLEPLEGEEVKGGLWR